MQNDAYFNNTSFTEFIFPGTGLNIYYREHYNPLFGLDSTEVLNYLK
jgi:hypothetical protein